MKVGKAYKFDSAHFITGHLKCGVMHGHTYHVLVMVKGEVEADGFVIDFNELDDVVKPIINSLDHKTLNKILPNPTCELLAEFLLSQIEVVLPEFNFSVRVQEGDGGWAEASETSEA